MREALLIWLALLVAALSTASVAGARELSRDGHRIDDPSHLRGISVPVRGGVIRPVGAVPGPGAGQEMPDLWGAPIDTFWYGGTVLDGGRPVADEPIAPGWANRKMWTWSAGGFNGTPHSGLNMDGWVGVDNTAPTTPTPEFRRMHCDSIGSCALNGNWEMFCGLTSSEAATLLFADSTATGYGNNWCKRVVSPTFAYNGSGAVVLKYVYRSDSEPDFDVASAELEAYREVSSDPPPDSGWVKKATLAYYSGSSGFASESLEISETLSGFGITKYRICLRFRSDKTWSDEDGLFPTNCGAFAFDDVSIVGGGVNYFNDFESGTDWDPITEPCPGFEVGDFARTEWIDGLSPPVSEDPCTSVPAFCDLADSVIVLFDPDPYPSWAPHPCDQDNYIQSPPIYLSSHASYRGFALHFEYFAKIRQCFWGSGDGHLPYWGVRYWPFESSQSWSDWTWEYGLVQTGNYHTEGLPVCGKKDVDVSGLIPASAESVQVRLGVFNTACCSCWDVCDENNNTPYYDNVCLGSYGSDVAPVVVMGEPWRWQDQFPKDGTLSVTSAADTRPALQLHPDDPSVFGDTLVCYSGSDDVELSLVFKIPKVGPGIERNHSFFTAWFPGILDVGGNPTGAWQTARMDTAVASGSPVIGYWMATFHEEDPIRIGNALGEGIEILPNDLFTPGTRVEYFLKAKYTGGGSEFLLPDTTGGYYLEFEVLPMMELMGEEIRWPCLILASHSLHRTDDGRYAIELVKDALTANGFVFDEYDRLEPMYAPSGCPTGIGRASSQGTFQGPGATIAQLAAYQALFVFGCPYGYALSQYDVEVLDEWLAASDSVHPRFLWVAGDDAVRRLNASWGKPLLENRLCASYVNNDYFLHSADNTYCLPVDGWSGGGIQCNALGGPEDEYFILAGNRCPRRFDVVDTSGVAGCGGQRELAYHETLNGESYAASVSAVVEESGGPWYRSLIEGYDFTAIRSDASLGVPECGSDTASAQARAVWVQCVLGDFGGLASAAYCNQATTISIEKPADRTSPPAYVTGLHQSYPNPMNPTATIHYSIGVPGKVSLRIFDVSGRVIRTLVEEVKTVGEYSAVWDGKNDYGKQVGSGVFFYQLEAPAFKSAKKIVILQ